MKSTSTIATAAAWLFLNISGVVSFNDSWVRWWRRLRSGLSVSWSCAAIRGSPFLAALYSINLAIISSWKSSHAFCFRICPKRCSRPTA
ncbi:hypothetical protein BJX61DRAFT_489620 [Aspergillus egyptiacus]|nr:hypothetical protein BJX61DRAFT_489620 [Aspergillus egyptiacus]